MHNFCRCYAVYIFISGMNGLTVFAVAVSLFHFFSSTLKLPNRNCCFWPFLYHCSILYSIVGIAVQLDKINVVLYFCQPSQNRVGETNF